MTPDAVLHRYQQVVSAPVVDTAALLRLISTDADLLNRWVTSLGTRVEPEAISRAMHHLAPDSLAAMARAQVWSVVPLGNAARLGFDQWRGVLLASCVAESLVREVGYPYPDAARLRSLNRSNITAPVQPRATPRCCLVWTVQLSTASSTPASAVAQL